MYGERVKDHLVFDSYKEAIDSLPDFPIDTITRENIGRSHEEWVENGEPFTQILFRDKKTGDIVMQFIGQSAKNHANEFMNHNRRN